LCCAAPCCPALRCPARTQLSEALRDNSSITSVNLSSNHIGDEGVAALVGVLQAGGCAELIALDLRGNSLSAEAEALLVRGCVRACVRACVRVPHCMCVCVCVWHSCGRGGAMGVAVRSHQQHR
jgi:hypothetical protein